MGEKLPIAIVSHGFMANKLTVKHYAKLLATKGYAAFCFDFSCGCVVMGKSDGKTTDMSVLTEVSDLCAVIEYAKSLEYTDERGILLMGCSQGGFVSALTAAKFKNEIKGYEGDVLIVHGTADKIVNITYAERVVETYKSEPCVHSYKYKYPAKYIHNNIKGLSHLGVTEKSGRGL